MSNHVLDVEVRSTVHCTAILYLKFCVVTSSNFQNGKDATCTVASKKSHFFTKVKLALKDKVPNHAAWAIESSWFDPLISYIERVLTGAYLVST
jgi:hypothetical protein